MNCKRVRRWLDLHRGDRFNLFGQLSSNLTTASGFTLIEVLVVVVLAGILATMATISGQSFWHARLLSAAQDEVFQALRQTQTQAIRTHANWSTSFQTANGMTQWSVHQANALSPAINWQTLDSRIEIDTTRTTLAQSSSIYRVDFNYRGHIPVASFGKLALQIKNGGNLRRCVVVSTLLGAMRKSNDCS